jgi:hypothetical protein
LIGLIKSCWQFEMMMHSCLCWPKHWKYNKMLIYYCSQHLSTNIWLNIFRHCHGWIPLISLHLLSPIINVLNKLPTTIYIKASMMLSLTSLPTFKNRSMAHVWWWTQGKCIAVEHFIFMTLLLLSVNVEKFKKCTVLA